MLSLEKEPGRGRIFELFEKGANNLLIADPSEQGFNLGSLLRGNWKQRRTSAAAVVAVKVACVLDAADAELFTMFWPVSAMCSYFSLASFQS
jgi:hypothetical protein